MYHTNSYTQNQYDDFFNLTTMNTDQNIYSNSNKTGFLNSDYGNDICEEFNSITRNGNEINIPQENPFEDSDNGFNVKIPDTISINISDDCSSVSSIVKTNEKIFNIEKEKEKINLFTNIKHDDKNEISYEDQIKRFSVKRDRYKNKDNILKKIITAFFNFYLLNAINLIFQNIGIKNYFEKFSLNHINKKNKIKIMNMTLKQFIEKAYHKQKNPKKKVDHNVYILNILEKYKKPVLKRILNTSLKELYEAYINSDEFKVNEINRLKKKNMNDWYINRYIFLSKNFLKCSE